MIVRMLVIRDVKMLVNAVVNAIYADAVVVNNVWCSVRRAVSDR